jgi:hypothetical protein
MMQKIHVSYTGAYLLQNISLEANICKTLSDFHIQANIPFDIFAYKRIFASTYSHTREYSLHTASNYLESL